MWVFTKFSLVPIVVFVFCVLAMRDISTVGHRTAVALALLLVVDVIVVKEGRFLSLFSCATSCKSQTVWVLFGQLCTFPVGSVWVTESEEFLLQRTSWANHEHFYIHFEVSSRICLCEIFSGDARESENKVNIHIVIVKLMLSGNTGHCFKLNLPQSAVGNDLWSLIPAVLILRAPVGDRVGISNYPAK